MFWNYVNECLKKFVRGRVVLLGNMNEGVENNERAGVAGKWSIDGVNEMVSTWWM